MFSSLPRIQRRFFSEEETFRSLNSTNFRLWNFPFRVPGFSEDSDDGSHQIKSCHSWHGDYAFTSKRSAESSVHAGNPSNVVIRLMIGFITGSTPPQKLKIKSQVCYFLLILLYCALCVVRPWPAVAAGATPITET